MTKKLTECIAKRVQWWWKVKVKVAWSYRTLCDPMDYSPWNSPGQNTGVGSLSLLQGIFPTQRLNPGLLHWRWINRMHSKKELNDGEKWKWKSLVHIWLFVTPWTIVHGILQVRILEWVAFPFSRGSSQPRDWTQVSRTGGGFLPAEPQGKPKNTGVHTLSLLQWIFPTQDWTRVSCICRWILYQLSYQGMMVRLSLILIIYSLTRVKHSRKKISKKSTN